MTVTPTVLALNSGSSSLKFGLYRVIGDTVERLWYGEATDIGADTSPLRLYDRHGQACRVEEHPFRTQAEVFGCITQWFAEGRLPPPDAIGHRLVHGGAQVRQHCRIDGEIMRQLEDAAAFAPLHVPAGLSGVRAMQAHFPQLPQVACLDTAFHADLPPVAATLPIGRALRDQGLQRYGFHGLSCESIVHQLGASLPPRTLIAHLGHGCSVTAVRAGRSIDTSMGLTPSGGVMMATRSGDLDPGILAYLVREHGLGPAALEDLIDRHAGMLGVSSLSGDLRQLRQAAAQNPQAQLAIDMFVYSVRKHVAGLVAALQGLDLLVFTGGIGEHDHTTRGEICDGLACFGLAAADNADSGAAVDAAAARQPRAIVLPAQEAEQIARHTARLAG